MNREPRGHNGATAGAIGPERGSVRFDFSRFVVSEIFRHEIIIKTRMDLRAGLFGYDTESLDKRQLSP